MLNKKQSLVLAEDGKPFIADKLIKDCMITPAEEMPPEKANFTKNINFLVWHKE